jgi:hypothetical protein
LKSSTSWDLWDEKRKTPFHEMTTRASVDTVDAAIRLFYETRAEGIAKELVADLYALTLPVQPVAPAQNGNEGAALAVPPQQQENLDEDDAPQAPAQSLARQILRKAQKR